MLDKVTKGLSSVVALSRVDKRVIQGDAFKQLASGDIANALRVQHDANEWLYALGGAEYNASNALLHVGYKVAFTNEAAQKRLGIETPAYGAMWMPRLLRDRVLSPLSPSTESCMIATPPEISLDEHFISHRKRFVVEAEIALRIARKIDKEVMNDVGTLEEVLERFKSPIAPFDVDLRPYVDAAALSLEMPDQRVQDSVVGMVADGVGGATAVRGPWRYLKRGKFGRHDLCPMQLEHLTLQLSRQKEGQQSEEVIDSGHSTEALGSPWLSLQFLAACLVAQGHSLNPGDVVFTGAVALHATRTQDEKCDVTNTQYTVRAKSADDSEDPLLPVSARFVAGSESVRESESLRPE
ncbi:MAG: hypothetical protein MHM6MM_006254 [Cercozoa sp. M6MM]